MPRPARVLFVILMLASFGPVEDYSQDIINPVPGYRQIRRTSADQPRDSVKACEAFFETLPRFGEPTSVVFTYFSQFDSEAGLEVMAKSETLTSLDISPYIVTIPGPVARGDTIQCHFQIIPRAVGYIDLSFIVYDPTNKLVRTPVRVGVLVYTKMLLAPSGETIALATPASSSIFGPVLGPYPELLKQGVTFAIDPKLPPDLQPPDYEEYLGNRPERYWYDVRLKVVPGNIPGSMTIRGTLSPYHTFHAGVGIEVHYSANQSVTRLSPSIQAPVMKDSLYNFYIEVKANSEMRTGVVSIGFATPNPDFGSIDRSFSHVRNELLRRGITLYTAFDESGNLAFVTDKHPLSRLDYRLEKGIKTKFTDDRLKRFSVYSFPRVDRNNVVYSENYDKIMSTYKAER